MKRRPPRCKSDLLPRRGGAPTAARREHRLAPLARRTPRTPPGTARTADTANTAGTARTAHTAYPEYIKRDSLTTKKPSLPKTGYCGPDITCSCFYLLELNLVCAGACDVCCGFFKELKITKQHKNKKAIVEPCCAWCFRLIEPTPICAI